VGLVLITDDGALAHRLLSPQSRVPKKYFVRVDSPFPPGIKESFGAGVTLGSGDKCLPAELKALSQNEAEVIIY
jgi:16S rRNA pseudouridine516 synthase